MLEFILAFSWFQANMVTNKVLTLAFIRETTRVLLGLKKRGFGEGRWNGFGGKVQTGESIELAAKRYKCRQYVALQCVKSIILTYRKLTLFRVPQEAKVSQNLQWNLKLFSLSPQRL